MPCTPPASPCASGCSSTSAATHGVAAESLAIDGTDVVDAAGAVPDLRRRGQRRAACSTRPASTTITPTEELDENGQGDCHTAFAFVAHRAVVDVDVDLGLVKVVQVATAQDVGRALNPLSVAGQVEGGISQGLGLAVMEEIVQIDGRIRNASFTDYLLPTMLDMPPVVMSLIEEPEPLAPLGRQGRRRAAVHLVDAGDRGRHSRRAAPGRARRTASTACPCGRSTSSASEALARRSAVHR